MIEGRTLIGVVAGLRPRSSRAQSGLGQAGEFGGTIDGQEIGNTTSHEPKEVTLLEIIMEVENGRVDDDDLMQIGDVPLP